MAAPPSLEACGRLCVSGGVFCAYVSTQMQQTFIHTLFHVESKHEYDLESVHVPSNRCAAAELYRFEQVVL